MYVLWSVYVCCIRLCIVSLCVNCTGAGVFVTTVVVGAISMAAPGAKLTRRPFLRDVLFYLIVVCLFVGIMKDQHVYAWEAGSCIGLYVVYDCRTSLFYC